MLLVLLSFIFLLIIIYRCCIQKEFFIDTVIEMGKYKTIKDIKIRKNELITFRNSYELKNNKKDGIKFVLQNADTNSIIRNKYLLHSDIYRYKFKNAGQYHIYLDNHTTPSYKIIVK